MPRVPVYSDRTVNPAGLPGPTISGAPVGQPLAQLGGSLEQLSGTLLEIRDQERQKADEIALTAAQNALERGYAEQLYGDASGQGGLASVQGREILPAIDTARERINKLTDETVGRLNERQRAAIQPWLQDRQTRWEIDALRYVSTEMTRERDQGRRDRAAIAQEMAVRHVADDAFAGYVAAGIADIEKWATPSEVEAWRSETVAMGIAELLDRDLVDDAKAMYAANRDEILVRHRRGIEAALGPREQRQKALVAADIAAEGLEPAGSRPDTKSVREAREKVNSIEDPQVRAWASSELERMIAEREVAWRDTQRDQFREEYDEIQRNGGQWVPSTDGYSTLDPDDLERLEMIAARARARSLGPEPETNEVEVWRRYRSKLPAVRADINPLSLAPFMTASDFAALLKEHQKLLDSMSETADPAQFKALRTWTQHVSNGVQSLGLRDEEAATFEDRANAAANALRQKLGREQLTDEEMQGVVDDLKRTVYVERSWNPLLPWRLRDPRAELGTGEVEALRAAREAGQRVYVPFESIPETDRRRLRNRVTARGLDADSREAQGVIEEVYAEQLLDRVFPPADLPVIREALSEAGLPETPDTVEAMRATLAEEAAAAAADLVVDETVPATPPELVRGQGEPYVAPVEVPDLVRSTRYREFRRRGATHEDASRRAGIPLVRSGLSALTPVRSSEE